MNTKHQISGWTALGLAAGLLLVTAESAAAQTTSATRARANMAAPKNITIRGNSQRTVTMDIRNAPVKDAIQQLFLKAGVDYILDPDVRGTVTIRATKVPFETAVRLLAQASDTPLSLYRNEVGVYEIRTRPTSYIASRNYRTNAPAETTVPVSYVEPTSITREIPPENVVTGMPTAGLPTGLSVGYPGFGGSGFGGPAVGVYPGFTYGFGGFNGFGGFGPFVQYPPMVQFAPAVQYPVFPAGYTTGGATQTFYPNGGWTTFGYPNGFFLF